MATAEATEACKFGQILRKNTPAQDFWKDATFPRGGYSFIGVVEGYLNSETGLREYFDSHLNNGSWLCDVAYARGATENKDGTLSINYHANTDVGTRGGTITLSGKEVNPGRLEVLNSKPEVVEWPEPGYRLVTGDGLWHPKTGIAFATTTNKGVAVKAAADYVKRNPERFKGWRIHEGWTDELKRAFGTLGKVFNTTLGFEPERHLENWEPEQLAYAYLTPWQNRPNQGTIAFLYCGFWSREGGAPCLRWDEYPEYRNDDLGAFLRSKE